MPVRKKSVSRRSAPKKRRRIAAPTKVPVTTRTFSITNTALAVALGCLGAASIAVAGMGTLPTCAAEPQKKVIAENLASVCEKQTLFVSTAPINPQPVFDVSGYDAGAITLQSNGTPAKKNINKNQAASFGYGKNTVMVTYLGLDDNRRALLKFFMVAPPSVPAMTSENDSNSTVTMAEVIAAASSFSELSQTSVSVVSAAD